VTVADQLWSLSGTTPLRLPEFTALPLAAANLANGGDLDHDGAEDLLLVTEDAIVAIAADLSTIGQSRPAATLQSARDDGPAFDVDGDGLPDLLGLYDGVPAVLSGASAFFAPCDADGDGISAAAGDCDDGDSSVHPLARDRCNGVDDDCDGVVDGPVDLALPRVGEQAPAAILLLDDGSAYDEPGDGLILDRDGVASGFGALDGIFVDGVLGRGPGTDQPAALLYAPTAADNLVAHGDSADFILPVGLSGDASTLATLTLRDGTGWTRTGQIAALGDIDGDGAGDAAFGLVDPIGHAGIAVLPVTASGTLSADDAEIFVQLPAGWTSWTLGTDDAGRGGDLDGDGRADLLLGSPAAYYGQGRVSVVVSPASGVLVVDDDALLHLYGEPGDGLGAAIALGDLDGDGTDDAALADQRGARLLHGAGCPVLGERRASENAWLAIVDADHSGLPELWSAGATGELLRDGEPFRQVLTLFGTADGALVYGDAEGEAVLRASCAPTP
jgi:hypothetical protein